MIEEPPVLTIKKTIRRPTPDQVAALKDAPASVVADAQDGGALHASIVPLAGGPTRAVGPAITADNGPADVLATFAALSVLQPGDVLVAAFAGHQGCAVAGDRVAGMMVNNGAAALVTDGPVRDIDGILATGLAVWCTGLTPASPYSNGPGFVGFPVQIGGQRVETGDIIVADKDGVVVVPHDRIDSVIARVRHVMSLESALDGQVSAGAKTFAPVDALMKTSRTRYVDDEAGAPGER